MADELQAAGQRDRQCAQLPPPPPTPPGPLPLPPAGGVQLETVKVEDGVAVWSPFWDTSAALGMPDEVAPPHSLSRQEFLYSGFWCVTC
ncbi:MAG: hypothetical protein ACR2NR_22535 [Solirubrobacteraceae bacterium]